MDRIKITATETGSARELFGHGDQFHVVAETPHGELYIFLRDFPTADRAERMAALVEQAGSIDVNLWTYWRVRYGSEAYREQEQEGWFMLQAGARLEDLPDEIRTLY